LFSDEIYELLEDDYGWLWMSCSKGIFRVRKRDLDALDQGKTKVITSISYGKPDGMAGTLCNGIAKPAGWKASDGRLWFCTTKGLVVVDPNIKVNERPPPVFIERLVADKQQVGEPSGRWVSGRSTPAYSTAHPFVIPPGRGELEFDYTALDFQTPDQTRFKYRLEGVDSDWIDAGTRRVAHYNNIYPGGYCFRVIAGNSDGVWNEAGAALPILVQPHLWQTWWFRGLAVLAILGAVGGAARYTTQKRMQRKLEALERRHAVERERGRIAKDIHDDLGSSLTRIMMLGERTNEDIARPEELAVHAGKIVTSARAAVQALDEIVWAVNPENDTLDGLVGYLNQYATQFFESTSVKCRLEMPATLSRLVLPAEIRHDLFLVVKEAMNNVLKHAQATEVRVRMAESATGVEIEIEDNGRGFEPGAGSAGRRGNGLENMRKRMEHLGGGFRLASTPGQGTKLEFAVSVNSKPAPG
jgi:signal transduction histidine kinase